MPLENAKKCVHVKMNGRQCQAPALRGGRYCVFHSKARQQTRKIMKKYVGAMEYEIPVLEDAHSVQMALMSVMQMLAKGSIEHKTAGLMLYALQTAVSVLRRTEFEAMEKDDEVEEPLDPEEIARKAKEEEEAHRARFRKFYYDAGGLNDPETGKPWAISRDDL